MRNLKRVLSLALASAMLLGMMVMGAGAANTSITDIDKVTNKEAVSLLVDLKVITGKPDGSYGPTETVDRATMSTLIYKIMTGETNADSYKGTGTLKDVSGTWAEGFINYCSSLKIVSGDGTNFYPVNKVTAAAAAKMLLTAIGYDAALSKYTGAGWEVNVMRDAKKAGILAGLATVKASDELTRDNAAQMIYNTLFAEIVKPDVDRDQGVAYLKGYIGQETTLAEETYAMKAVTAMLMGTKATPFATKKTLKDGQVAVAKAEYDSNGKFSKYSTTETVLTIGASSSLVGHEVKYFENADGDLLSSALVDTGKTDVSTYIWSATTKDNDDFVADMTFTGTKYSKNYGTAGTTKLNPNIGNTVIYINTDGAKDMEYVVITDAKFDEVTDVNTTKGTIKFATLGTRNVKDVDGAADLAKGDFVITTQMASAYSVKKAESVEGTMTAKTTSKISIDGTSYSFSATEDFATANGKNVTEMKKLTVKDAVSGVYYLDPAGKVIVFVPSEEVDTTVNYAYIEALSVKEDEWSHDMTVSAKVILSGGTRETLVLNKDCDLAKAAAAVASNAPALKALAGAYPYTLKDEEIVADDGERLTVTKGLNFTTGAPSLKGDKKGPFADDSTVVLFFSPKTSTSSEVLKSYTGVKNIPNFKPNTDDDNIFVALDKDNVYAKFIFVSGVPADAVSDAQYAFSLSAFGDYTEVANGYAYSFVINGEKDELVFSAKFTDDTLLKKNTIYTYTETDKGIATIAAITTPAVVSGTVTAVTSGYVIVKVGNDNVTYYLTGDETIDDLTDFNDDGKLVPSVGSLSKGDSVKLFANGDNEVIKAYIVPAAAIDSVSVSPEDDQTANVELTVTVAGATDVKVSYQWYKATSSTANPAADTKVGTDSTTYTTTTAKNTTEYFYCVVTATSQIDSTVTVSVTSNVVEIAIPNT